jgi:hypothetical protein
MITKNESTIEPRDNSTDYYDGYQQGLYDEALQELQGGIVETGVGHATPEYQQGYLDARSM